MDATADTVPHFRPLVGKAVEIVGSQSALAEGLNKSQQHVSALCTRATFISAEDAIGIHRLTFGEVPASSLRPDLWRRPEDVPVDYVEAPSIVPSQVTA